MPLTKRQFELGVGEETEILMRTIYSILAKDREHAYGREELFQKVSSDPVTDFTEQRKEKIGRALDVLVRIGAVELREVVGTSYYTFYQEADQSTWELKIAV